MLNKRHFIFLPFWASLCCLLLSACSEFPDHKETNGVYWKMVRFGEGSTWKEADFSRIVIRCTPYQQQEKAVEYTLYSGYLKAEQDSGSSIAAELMPLLENMKLGEELELIVPYQFIDRTMLDGYKGNLTGPEDKVQLNVRLENIFERQDFAQFIMNAAQLEELTEVEAIGLYFVNHQPQEVEQRGDVFIERLQTTTGDSISAGCDITIQLHTFLLSGQKLDQLTTLSCTFGRPGQLVPGLQYALSFLKEGEKAKIYMPSYLAFGEEGSTSGVVPAHTPVYFSVHVVEVKTPSELVP
jgi:FKBP-type peptidyl-prolyl cis-trans isomerase